MSELSTEERLAALRARRQPDATPKPVPTPEYRTPVAAPDHQPIRDPQSGRLVRRPLLQELLPDPAANNQPFPQAVTPTTVLSNDVEQPTQAFQPAAPAAATAPAPATATAAQQPLPYQSVERRFEWSWNRVAATGASVVSFASMIVAMGPILKSVESTETESADPGSVNLSVAGAEVPVAPPVDIEVIPSPDGAAGITTDPTAQPLAETPPAEGEADTPESAAGQPGAPETAPPETAPAPQDNGEAAQTTPPETAPPETAPASTEAPTTAPATPASTAAPQAPTAPLTPTTTPPTTTPSATAAPTTQPPATTPPTTAPPTTQAPVATPPPKSEGSGG